MKGTSFTTIVFALMIAFMGSSCGSNPAGTDAEGIGLKGNLGGHFLLLDEYGSRLSDQGRITVGVTGTSRASVTAENGWWNIKDLPQGTYTLTMSKPGFIPYTGKPFQFTGGGNAIYDEAFGNVIYDGNTTAVGELWHMAGFTITSFSATSQALTFWDSLFQSGKHITFVGTVSAAAARERPITVYLSATSPASLSGSIHHFSIAIPAQQTEFSYSLPIKDLEQQGITAGTRIYAVAYPGGTTTNGDNRPLSTPLPSNEISVVMP